MTALPALQPGITPPVTPADGLTAPSLACAAGPDGPAPEGWHAQHEAHLARRMVASSRTKPTSHARRPAFSPCAASPTRAMWRCKDTLLSWGACPEWGWMPRPGVSSGRYMAGILLSTASLRGPVCWCGCQVMTIWRFAAARLQLTDACVGLETGLDLAASIACCTGPAGMRSGCTSARGQSCAGTGSDRWAAVQRPADFSAPTQGAVHTHAGDQPPHARAMTWRRACTHTKPARAHVHPAPSVQCKPAGGQQLPEAGCARDDGQALHLQRGAVGPVQAQPHKAGQEAQLHNALVGSPVAGGHDQGHHLCRCHAVGAHGWLCRAGTVSGGSQPEQAPAAVLGGTVLKGAWTFSTGVHCRQYELAFRLARC